MNATLTLALIPTLSLQPLPGRAAANATAPRTGCQCEVDQRAADAAGASPPAAELPPDTGCGWFDSSWALHQGLSVTELPDSDGVVAALWFPASGRQRLAH